MELEKIASTIEEFGNLSKKYIVNSFRFQNVGIMPYTHEPINCVILDEFDNILKSISDNLFYDFYYGGKEAILTDLIEGGFFEPIYYEDLPEYERCEGKEDEISFYLITPQNLIDYIRA